MKNKLSILTLLLSIPLNIFANPSDYGRPWDDPDYHSSPISKILIQIGIIILIIFAIGWISSNVANIY